MRILKTTPHNYLALRMVYKALLYPLAFLPEPRKAGKDVHPHFTEEETGAQEGSTLPQATRMWKQE